MPADRVRSPSLLADETPGRSGRSPKHIARTSRKDAGSRCRWSGGRSSRPAEKEGSGDYERENKK